MRIYEWSRGGKWVQMGKDIDAVTVVTPDHTHFPAAMLAMSMGKHVYVEKPLTHSYREADLLMKAEKKFGVVTQMGNQGHTSGGSVQFAQLLKARFLGRQRRSASGAG